MAPGSPEGQGSRKCTAQHTHTHFPHCSLCITIRRQWTWTNQLKMAEVSMEVPVWRVIACNQIPSRELVQGVYPWFVDRVTSGAV